MLDVTLFSNWTISYVEVQGSVVHGPHNAVLVGGSGAAAGGEDGEQTQDAEAYGALGIVVRPRPPSSVPDGAGGTETVGAEAMAARTSDGLVPLAWRDLRLNRAFPAPKPGTVAVVGYGGGFVSFDDTDTESGDQLASRVTLYCPFQFASGVGAKAHAVVLDPDENSVSVVHADGAAVVLTEDATILKGPDGTAFIELSDGKIVINAPQVVVRGGMLIGDESLPTPFPVVYMLAGVPIPSTLITVSA